MLPLKVKQKFQMRVGLEHPQCSQRRDGPQQGRKTLKGRVHWEVMNDQHEEARDSRSDSPENTQNASQEKSAVSIFCSRIPQPVHQLSVPCLSAAERSL